MNKLEKKSSEASNKGSGDKDSYKESNHDEDSDDEHIPKRGSMLGSMSVEQIQILIANAIKAQLGEGSHKETYTQSLIQRELTSFACPMAINRPNSISSMERATVRNTLYLYVQYVGTERDLLVK